MAEHCVNSIADLKALGAAAFPCVTVLGYHIPGDGGGGDFFWDNSFNMDLKLWPDGHDGGTVIRPNDVQSLQAGRWRRMFDRGAVSVRWFGAAGDGWTDDTDAIQAAEDVAAPRLHRAQDPFSDPGTVFFPSGNYIINGAKATIPGDTRKYGINKKSTKWVGSGYTLSILRLKNNSTSGGVDPQMIYANATLSDIGFYHLGFDLNGENNPTSTQANVAAIWFNGEQLRVHGMVVEDCKFYHGPGGTVILVQNRATPTIVQFPIVQFEAYPLDDVLILNNRFEDNCLSPATNDHSTMNIWARRTRVIGNVFEETSAVPAKQRYYNSTAMEFHGGDGLFLGNVIRGYGTVVIASENFVEAWQNLLVTNNVVSDLGLYFIETAVEPGPHSKPIDQIVVRGNHVVLNDYASGSGGYKTGLMQRHKRPISYIEVSDNYFEMASPSAVLWSTGVMSEQDSPRISYTTHLKVSGNTFNKMKFSVWVDNNNFDDQVKNLEYVNNTCLNMQDLNAKPEAAGLWADGAASQHIENLVVTGNRFLNEANYAGYKYGIVLTSYNNNLVLADNVFYNIKGQNVWQR